ncbi:MAG: hypothetical protein ACXV2C_04910 [Candidatus Bathyarchaeia archaeon]
MDMDLWAKSKFNKKLAAIIVGVTVIVAVIVSWQAIQILQEKPSNVVPSDLNLTIVGVNRQQIILNSNDIANLSAFTSEGGFKSGGGAISAETNYTGVPILTLCNLAGGIASEDNLTVTGSDGYSVVYTYTQVNGQGFITYDPVTGNQKQASQPLRFIIAYYASGKALSSDEGPLLTAIVGPEGLLTQGRLWVKHVAKIEIESP